MLTAPLPSQIDVRKLVVKCAEISAQMPVSSLPRIADMLANDIGVIAVNLRFFKDEGHFRRIDGELKGSVEMTCQRCLEPLTVAVDTRFSLGIMWSEEDAERLPKSLEPLIVGEEELVNLADVVAEELILSLPFVNYHAPSDCKQQVGYSSGDSDPSVEAAEKAATRENPFKVLENLKFDK
ncbi:MAG: YceD family protein [Oceanicoccus sp.]|jgi:uncharacterized protein